MVPTPRAYADQIKPGAENAVRNCLKIQPGEKVTLITDERTKHIAQALLDVVEEIGAEHRLFHLEQYNSRPLMEMPEEILRALTESHAGIYCAQIVRGEIGMRMQTIHAVENCDVRYAHMVGITDEIMKQSMRADYQSVYALGQRLIEVAQDSRTARIRTKNGTDVRFELGAHVPWLNTGGRITPRKWSNLPAGEIFTAPEFCEGVFVGDGSVGDFLCAKYGCIDKTPLRLEIKGGRLTAAHCEDKELERDFWDYCHTDENSDRVGELAIGTNTTVTKCIGNLLQDEKMPGAHIAFGDPAKGQTGALWSCKTHIDVITQQCDIWFDDHQAMKEGKFLV